ncbi:MAG: hypothetical protein Q9181_007578, partial [Wetmoreana brouardii]
MSQHAAESSGEIQSSTSRRESHPELEMETPNYGVDRTMEAVTVESHREHSPRPKKPRAFYLGFTGLAVNLFIIHLDATALGVALPTIAGELHGTSLESFWANISYNLCVVVTQPLWASVSQAFGRKPPLYVSLGLFAGGSLAFALARHMSAIILGRVLQGLGGGGLDVLTEIILADMTTLGERSFYLGLMALPISVGTILGPLISAVFSTFVSWRWIGWVNLPLLGFACPLFVFYLRLRSVALDTSLVAKLKRLDWVGMILSVVGITIFVLPLSWGGALYPWSSWRTLLPMLLGVAVLIVFAIYEAYPAAPIVPHRLFRSKTANMTLAGGFTHGMIMFSILQYLPLFYQAVELETVIGSAVSLLPASVTSVAVAGGSMMLVSVVGGGYRWVIWSAWMSLTLGTGLLALLDLESSSSMRFGIPVLWGVGVALLRLLLLPMQASVQKVDDTGLAIAQLLTFRFFGGLVGLAVASTTFSSVFSASISSSGQFTGPLTPLDNADEGIAFITELRKLDISPEVLDPVLKIYLKSFRTIFYTMTGLAA